LFLSIMTRLTLRQAMLAGTNIESEQR